MPVAASRDISFTFGLRDSQHGTAAFECALEATGSTVTNGSSGAQFQACSSPMTFASLEDGRYQFSVRAQGEQVADTRSFTKAGHSLLMAFSAIISTNVALAGELAGDSQIPSSTLLTKYRARWHQHIT